MLVRRGLFIEVGRSYAQGDCNNNNIPPFADKVYTTRVKNFHKTTTSEVQTRTFFDERQGD